MSVPPTRTRRSVPRKRSVVVAVVLVVLAGSTLAGCRSATVTSRHSPSPAPAAVATTGAATATATGSSSPAGSAGGAPQAIATTTPPTARTATAGLVAVAGVVDGDTIKVTLAGRTERVRVIGIDTPELAQHQCYAQQAASKMQSLVQSKSVRLVADRTQADRDRYGRLLRHVQLADGRSVAQILIAGGFGEEYTYDGAYAGQAAYRAAQQAARSKHLGIWSSACFPASPAPATSAACLIKGNIASDGERIYHVPGQQYYDVTKISEAKGERWFCTEAEAVAAGWRRSKR